MGIGCESRTVPAAVCPGPDLCRTMISRHSLPLTFCRSGRRRETDESEDLPLCFGTCICGSRVEVIDRQFIVVVLYRAAPERNGRCSDVAGEESACRERRRPCGLSEVPGSGRTGRVPDRLCGAEDRGRSLSGAAAPDAGTTRRLSAMYRNVLNRIKTYLPHVCRRVPRRLGPLCGTLFITAPR